MCFTFVSSVLNLIYSKQLVFIIPMTVKGFIVQALLDVQLRLQILMETHISDKILSFPIDFLATHFVKNIKRQL